MPGSWAPWLGGDFFMAVAVKEAFNLEPGSSMRGAHCDPFVRVTLQRPGALAMAEAETRVLDRNCFPLWEECLPFTLTDVSEDTILAFRVLDKDIGAFNSFVGSVSIPIKEVLSAITELGVETQFRLPLQDRAGNGRRPGELSFAVSIMAKQQYHEVCSNILATQDADKVHDQLGSYALHLRLHRFTGLAGLSASQGAALDVKLSLCSYEVRKPLSCALTNGEADPELELVIPLGPAFADGSTLKGRSRTQFGDVKIALYSGKTRLVKTQVPIWDVPFMAAASRAVSGPSPEPQAPAAALPAPEALPAMAEAKSSASLICNLTQNLVNAVGVGRTKSEPASVMAVSAAPSPQPSEAPPVEPPSPPPPLWAGKLYYRRMERLEKILAGQQPTVVVSMQLVKADLASMAAASATVADAVQPQGEGSGGSSLSFDAPDVDAPAEAFAAPPPLEHVVGDYVVHCGPHALCRAVFGPECDVAVRVAQRENMSDHKTGAWGPDPEGKVHLVRQLSYMKPTPVGPTSVQAEQKLAFKSDGGFILQNRVTPNVPPAGQCVHVMMQVVAQHVGPGRTRLTASLKTVWFKTGFAVNLVKGKVDDASPKDARKYFETLRTELVAKFGSEGPGAGAPAGALAAAGPDGGAGAASGLVAYGAPAVGYGAPERQPAGPPPAALLGVLAAVALLLLLTWVQLRAVTAQLARSSRALEVIGEAALAAVGRMVPSEAVCAAAAQQ